MGGFAVGTERRCLNLADRKAMMGGEDRHVVVEVLKSAAHDKYVSRVGHGWTVPFSADLDPPRRGDDPNQLRSADEPTSTACTSAAVIPIC